MDPQLAPDKLYLVSGKTLAELYRRARPVVAGNGLRSENTANGELLLWIPRTEATYPFRVRDSSHGDGLKVAVYDGAVKTGVSMLRHAEGADPPETTLDVSDSGIVAARLDFSGAWPGTPTLSIEYVAGATLPPDENDTARIQLAQITVTDGSISEVFQFVRSNLLHYRTVVWYSYPERIIHDWGYS